MSEQRLRLRACGYLPIPLFGKTPAPKEWQKITAVSPEMIAMWTKSWPTATNTGILTRLSPTLDLDLLHEPAAAAAEEFVRDFFVERGTVMSRIGKPPKRAILFRTSRPFRKITALLRAPDGGEEKIELLADGQQVVVDGIHPGHRQAVLVAQRRALAHPASRPAIPRRSRSPRPRRLHREYRRRFRLRAPSAPARGNGGNGGGGNGDDRCDRWVALVGNIGAGRALHDSIRDLACMLILAGMHPGAAKHLLDALAERIEPYDARVEARLRDIPRAIDTAVGKYSRR